MGSHLKTTEPPRTSEETENYFFFFLKRNMCNTRQDNPQQNHPWQGVYPDLIALNELFSAPAAVNPEQPSPWIPSWLLWVFNPFQELSRKLDQQKTNQLHVRGQPLADPANWGVRFTGANTAWAQHRKHHH